MRLTDGHRYRAWTRSTRRLSPHWALIAVVLGLAIAFLVDRTTGSLPFQHLYYLPIILAALQFGLRGALVSSATAILLYHLGNPDLLSFSHEAPDVVQIALFVVIGVVTARLRDDASRLARLAGTDDLTGLHNLRGFEHRLRDSLERARVERTPLSILVVDLDGLKALNDAHGHLAGAEAVRAVGRTIASQLPRASFACRYGGDEFVVALPGLGVLASQETATAILGSVRSAAPTLGGRPFPRGTLSVSIGLACLDLIEADASGTDLGRVGEALFNAADAALYDAKRAGRSRVEVARGLVSPRVVPIRTASRH